MKKYNWLRLAVFLAFLAPAAFAAESFSPFSLSLDLTGKGSFAPDGGPSLSGGLGGKIFGEWRPLSALSFGTGFSYTDYLDPNSWSTTTWDLGGRLFPFGPGKDGEFYLQGGLGLNLFPDAYKHRWPGNYNGTAGLGYRANVLGPGAALDFGVAYEYNSPHDKPLQSIGARAGVVIFIGEKPTPTPVAGNEAAYLKEGIRLFAAKDYAGALKYFRAVAGANPHSIDALKGAGNCYYHLGYKDDARTAYTRALALAPADTQLQKAVSLLGGAVSAPSGSAPAPPVPQPQAPAAASGTVPTAASGKAPALSANGAKYLKEAERLYAAKDYLGALKYFRATAGTDTQSADALKGAGNCYYRLGYRDNARTAYARALALDPADPQLQKVVSFLGGAVTSPSGSAPALSANGAKYLKEAERLFAAKDYTNALKNFQAVADTDPRSALAFQGEGNCYYFSGQKDQALAAFNQALALDPSNTRLRDFVQKLQKPPN